jgi:hypothetical protein
VREASSSNVDGGARAQASERSLKERQKVKTKMNTKRRLFAKWGV